MTLLEERTNQILKLHNGDIDKAVNDILASKDKAFGSINSNPRKERFWLSVIKELNLRRDER